MKIDGTRIKPLRESMGLTIQQLADEVDLSPSAIGMYERGQRTPKLKIILVLAEFFSVDVNYFVIGFTVSHEQIENSYIAAEVFERASGICELCNTMAPFIRSNGQPYLETYILKDHSISAEHVAAVCPNCLKKLEVLQLPGDIIYLKNKIYKN
ncbi:helix-turn-helix domain-containing protein [Paenibacillus polymyxa]|uniref:helix-turn-helix domain-containing protein n=1 Tax=Paenibacillus polymyxa TaxID=1406 RepID=UPI00021BBAAC|nr:helix-turn-helix transcriptional regulator [Paenibacillus polymyxa]MDN4106090.1 helix-turn-helix transcriptional regulator [Paenibacillus polymyxa]CCC86440.1 putative HTH-type transcriptional regulatory protein [Paenibacillus polymyxa M1]